MKYLFITCHHTTPYNVKDTTPPPPAGPGGSPDPAAINRQLLHYIADPFRARYYVSPVDYHCSDNAGYNQPLLY